jgi:hypothetical protein
MLEWINAFNINSDGMCKMLFRDVFVDCTIENARMKRKEENES